MRLTQRRVNDWLAKWKRLLRLEDWDIVAALCDRKFTGGADGTCTPSRERRHALIKIAKKTPHPSGIIAHDPEQTLVHELLHVKFSAFELQESASLAAKEQESVVDQLATLLVTLDRSTRDRGAA